MQGRFPPKILVKYPHLAAADKALWNLFLGVHAKDFNSFDYDVKVGDGVTADEDVHPNLIKDYQDLTKKRIDAVGYQADGVTLFEVKPRAGTEALGQLLSYKHLYNETYPGVTVKALTVITAMMLPDEKKVYEAYGINVYIHSE